MSKTQRHGDSNGEQRGRSTNEPRKEARDVAATDSQAMIDDHPYRPFMDDWDSDDGECNEPIEEDSDRVYYCRKAKEEHER